MTAVKVCLPAAAAVGRGMLVGVLTPTRGALERAQGRRSRRGVPPVRVTLLDSFAVSIDGADAKIGAAERRVVALAALRARPLRRPQVADLLWPHLDSRTAASSLRTALSRLRAVLPELLHREAGLLRLADGVLVDAWEVEQLASRLVSGDGAAGHGTLDGLTAQLLPEWREDWVVFERDRLHDICMHAIEAHAARLASARRFSEAIVAVCEALRADPLRESAARTLVGIHLADSNRASAARAYLHFRERSLSQLGMEPSEEFRALVRPLLSGPGARPR